MADRHQPQGLGGTPNGVPNTGVAHVGMPMPYMGGGVPLGNLQLPTMPSLPAASYGVGGGMHAPSGAMAGRGAMAGPPGGFGTVPGGMPGNMSPGGTPGMYQMPAGLSLPSGLSMNVGAGGAMMMGQPGQHGGGVGGGDGGGFDFNALLQTASDTVGGMVEVCGPPHGLSDPARQVRWRATVCEEKSSGVYFVCGECGVCVLCARRVSRYGGWRPSVCVAVRAETYLPEDHQRLGPRELAL